MSSDYWQGYIDDSMNEECDTSGLDSTVEITKSHNNRNGKEYVNMQRLNGESVRFKRTYGDYRFSDTEVEHLIAGMEVKINTHKYKGIIGFLDFQEYNGQEYFGFSPWDSIIYSVDNAPFPLQWSGYEFTDTDEKILRDGKKLLISTVSGRTGNSYGVHLSFGHITHDDGYTRWGITPHFEEFNLNPLDMDIDNCVFNPTFNGRNLTQGEISLLRKGKAIKVESVSKSGNMFTCELTLELDRKYNRWILKTSF